MPNFYWNFTHSPQLSVDGDLSVGGNETLAGDLTADGTTTLGGSVPNNTVVNGNLTVNQRASIIEPLTAYNTIYVGATGITYPEIVFNAGTPSPTTPQQVLSYRNDQSSWQGSILFSLYDGTNYKNNALLGANGVWSYNFVGTSAMAQTTSNGTTVNVGASSNYTPSAGWYKVTSNSNTFEYFDGFSQSMQTVIAGDFVFNGADYFTNTDTIPAVLTFYQIGS